MILPKERPNGMSRGKYIIIIFKKDTGDVGIDVKGFNAKC